jgi:glycosyltransferase involved in cell wall biosynthesis
MATKPQIIKNLLFFGDFNCTTGFGNVSKELIENWAKDKNLKIAVFAINDYTTEPYDYLPNVKVIPAMSTVLADEPKDDVYCRIQFLRLLMHNDFDVVFCLNDIEIFNEMGEHLQNVKNEKRKLNKPNFKSMVYFPIDSEPRPVDLKILNFFDEVITYTEYAKSVMRNLTTEANFKKIKVIPHGCNTTEFYPLSDAEKLEAKLELLGEAGNDETYLFGTINRNSARKDLASLILGFATFKHHNQVNAVLYLHCNPLDPSGINVYRLCERVGLRVGIDVLVPKEYSENKGCDNVQLNRIYNAFDCFITTTTAEGWGLTVTEAMATKTLVICPKHTSLTEITNDGDLTLNFMFMQPAVFINDFEKIRFVSNPSEVNTLLGVAYNLKNDEQELQDAVAQKIERAYEKVKGMSWDKIAKQFKVKIDKLAK